MSIQHKLDRVRPPRVNITYDVATGNAVATRELPFVIGVVADLSGHPEKPLKNLRDKERTFTDVTPENFDTVLKQMQPRLKFRVRNTASQEENAQIGVELKFSELEDFEPQRIVSQVPSLRKLERARARLKHLANELQGNMDAEDNLLEALKDRASLEKLLEELPAPREAAADAAQEPGKEDSKQ
jgi:type VI secretion system protein ImpB